MFIKKATKILQSKTNKIALVKAKQKKKNKVIKLNSISIFRFNKIKIILFKIFQKGLLK